MKTVTISIPHGVVFLYDPTMLVDVPEDTGRAPLLATPNCVSIWTLAEDDGQVNLIFDADNVQLFSLNVALVFDGIIKTEGKILAFNDSACNPMLSIDVLSKSTRLQVFTNHKRYPTTVLCVIDES